MQSDAGLRAYVHVSADGVLSAVRMIVAACPFRMTDFGSIGPTQSECGDSMKVWSSFVQSIQPISSRSEQFIEAGPLRVKDIIATECRKVSESQAARIKPLQRRRKGSTTQARLYSIGRRFGQFGYDFRVEPWGRAGNHDR